MEAVKDFSHIWQHEKGPPISYDHRVENTDDPAHLCGVLAVFANLGEPVVLPIHPRTRKTLERLNTSVLLPSMLI